MTLPDWINSFTVSLVVEFMVTLVSIGAAYLIRNTWIKWRYGGWTVVVIKHGVEQVNRPVSAGKIKEVQDEVADLAVFLKGVASNYERNIREDIVSKKSREIGLLVVDRVNKKYIVDLDKNPPVEPPAAAAAAGAQPAEAGR